jgi:hypothetical protein
MSSPPERTDLPELAVLLLVLVTAVPAAVIVLPDTASYVVPQAVRDLGLADGDAPGFVRACGLALPALLLAVPPAAALARRVPAWAVLFTGLAILLGAEAASAYATTVPLVGAVRLAEGAGGGLILPPALVLAWERRERRVAAGVWAGVLTASLLLATPLVLSAAPWHRHDDAGWRAVLHPFWWLGAAALVGTGLLGLLRARRRAPADAIIARTRRGERAQLLLPVVPAAGFAFLAVVTAYDWSPGAQLVLAACGLAGLIGLAVVGSRGAVTGSPLGHAVVMVAAGLLTMPVTGPLAGLVGGRAMSLTPFAAGAACAALAAPCAVALSRGVVRGAVYSGYGLTVAAIVLLLTLGIDDGSSPMLGGLCALGTGLGLAVGAASRHVEAGPGLFGLSLCFPAALGGHLVVGPLQVARVGAVIKTGGGRAEVLFALTDAYRTWLMVAGAMAVLLAGVTAWVSRRRAGRATGIAAAQEADGAAVHAG